MAGLAPTPSEVIRGAIRAALAEVMTSTVGKVQTYDPLTQTANIIPVMKRAYNVGYGVVDYEDLPVLPNVPVRQPRAGGFHIHMPVEPGDHVLLLFTHDDIANWRETGTSSEPDDLRRHSLNSCVALVGMADALSPLPVLDPLEVAARLAGLVIGKEGSTAQIQWTADDEIQFGRPSTVPPGVWLPLPPGARVGTPVSPVALADPTDAAIAQLKAEITVLTASVAALAAAQAAATTAAGAAATVFATHVHVCAAPGSPCVATATPMGDPAPAAPAPPAVGPAPLTVASTLVKGI